MDGSESVASSNSWIPVHFLSGLGTPRHGKISQGENGRPAGRQPLFSSQATIGFFVARHSTLLTTERTVARSSPHENETARSAK